MCEGLACCAAKKGGWVPALWSAIGFRLEGLGYLGKGFNP